MLQTIYCQSCLTDHLPPPCVPPEDTNHVNHSLNHSNIELNEKISPNSNFTGNSDSNIPAEHEQAFDNFTQALYSALNTHDPVMARTLLDTVGTLQRTQNQDPGSPILPSPPQLDHQTQLLQSPPEPS